MNAATQAPTVEAVPAVAVGAGAAAVEGAAGNRT